LNITFTSQKILSAEIWFLFALSALSLFWIQLLPLITLAAIFFWTIRLIGNGYLTMRTPADWGIGLLCLAMLVTVYATTTLEKTMIQVWRFLAGIALFYAIVNWCSSHSRIRLLFTGLTLAGLGLALFAPFSVLWTFDKITFIPELFYRYFSILVSDSANPSVMAGSLVILLPFPLSILIFRWKRAGKIDKMLAALAFSLMMVMLILTRARGAWTAAAAVFLTLLLLFDRRSWILIFLGIVILIALVMVLGDMQILEVLLYSNTVGDLDTRLEIWSRALILIRDFPYTGVGMGSFQEAAETFFAYDQYAPAYIPHAHNIFMQVAVDLGMLGLVAWCSIFLTMIYLSWRFFRYGKLKGEQLIMASCAALLASQVALIINGLTDAVVWGMVRPAPLVWVIWGYAAAISIYSINRVKHFQTLKHEGSTPEFNPNLNQMN
jgi:putative inorganic carbon (HCO3(-)) transporter